MPATSDLPLPAIMQAFVDSMNAMQAERQAQSEAVMAAWAAGRSTMGALLAARPTRPAGPSDAEILLAIRLDPALRVKVAALVAEAQKPLPPAPERGPP